MRRVVVPELLDSDTGTPREVTEGLADLRMLNRRFGGTRTTSSLLQNVAIRRQLKTVSLLDVGGASGDVAAAARESLAQSGITLETVLLDRAPTHLGRSHPAVCGDALALPFADNSFDVIGCSLFLHHLEPPQIVAFTNEALRVARHALVINDLVRHPIHWTMAAAGCTIYRSRLTRHDAPVSVRRAYTVPEVRQVMKQTDASLIEIRSFYFFRMGVTAWKKPHTT
ncbi:MAG TPA: methyltransferase domain-containing protein [Verrucomicrobiae bacterium]|nr:methyltransferase domain-containing protein [Verrucomicrobiae bacterium]